MSGRDEFYVGYQPRAPEATARFVRRVVVLMLATGAAIAVAIALAQRPPAPAAFEFGMVRTVSGVLRERPYPMLLVRSPGGGGRLGEYLLTGYGKRGAAALVAGRDGMEMTFEGTMIYRGPHVMVEINSEPVFSTPEDATALHRPSPPYPVLLQGEIVDSKCHLGAMNPGSGTTHRLCALRCLRGGLPPLLALGGGGDLLLTGPDGGPAGTGILPYVGLPIRIRGTVREAGSWRILEADLESIRLATAP